MRMERVIVAGVATLALGASASAHVGDVGLRIIDGQIKTGKVIETTTSKFVEVGERVFGGDLGALGPNAGDEPGFFAVTGEFPANSGLGFNAFNGLRVWNGNGFDPAGAGRSADIAFGPNSVTLTGTSGFTAGFDFNVGPTGGFDEHWDFLLDLGAPSGIYLIEVELWSTLSTISASDRTWIVLNNNLSELEHDEAIEWVEDNLVPSPSAVALLGMAGLVAARRRRA